MLICLRKKTNQRQEPELGAPACWRYFYNARWYDPYLGRFTQADTIVPNPVDAKAFDRYAYVYNNPVRYNDPSGHMCSDPEDPTPSCDGSGKTVVNGKLLSGNWSSNQGGTSASSTVITGPEQTQGVATLSVSVFPDDLWLVPANDFTTSPFFEGNPDFTWDAFLLLPPPSEPTCSFSSGGIDTYCRIDEDGKISYGHMAFTLSMYLHYGL